MSVPWRCIKYMNMEHQISEDGNKTLHFIDSWAILNPLLSYEGRFCNFKTEIKSILYLAIFSSSCTQLSREMWNASPIQSPLPGWPDTSLDKPAAITCLVNSSPTRMPQMPAGGLLVTLKNLPQRWVGQRKEWQRQGNHFYFRVEPSMSHNHRNFRLLRD